MFGATTRTEHTGVRERLGERLHGLRRRVTHARETVANPWIRFGAAVAAGYWLGCREPPKPDASQHRDTILGSLLRNAVLSFGNAVIRDVIGVDH